MAGVIGSPCDASRLTSYTTPWGLTVTVNKAVERRFREACNKAFNKSKWRRRTGRKGWVPKRIDSYNCRQIRGSSSWSRHAYGAAWDFFDRPWPEPVDVWGNDNSPPEWFANCFKQYGFTWGGDWQSRPDFPHLEWSGSSVPSL